MIGIEFSVLVLSCEILNGVSLDQWQNKQKGGGCEEGGRVGGWLCGTSSFRNMLMNDHSKHWS